MTSIPNFTSADRVRRYLVEEFSRPDIKEGTRLPTARELSKQLSVSSATVSQVFRELSREGMLMTRVGSGTYLVSRPKELVPARRLTVALNCPIPVERSEAPWTYNVMQSVLHAATRGDRRVTVLPLSDHAEKGSRAVETLRDEVGFVDGLIFVPGYQISHEERDRLLVEYSAAGKGWVTLHQPTVTTTTNFVSTDYYSTCQKLGSVWYQTGRRRIALLGSMEHAEKFPVVLHRLWGLQSGKGEASQGNMAVDLIHIPSTDEAGAFEDFRRYLGQTTEIPDAILCNGDYQALGVLRALRERGIEVPRDTSVVGLSGLSLQGTHCPDLTSFVQPFDALGEELMRILIQRVQAPAADVGGVYLPLSFRGGATTRPEENDLLGLKWPS